RDRAVELVPERSERGRELARHAGACVVAAALRNFGRGEPAERLAGGRLRVAGGERERLPAIRRRDEPRRAPRLAAHGRERDAELGPRGGTQAAVREAPALHSRIRALAHVQKLTGLERFDGEAAAVLAR